MLEIFITDLCAYNNGFLIRKWITLPLIANHIDYEGIAKDLDYEGIYWEIDGDVFEYCS